MSSPAAKRRNIKVDVSEDDDDAVMDVPEHGKENEPSSPSPPRSPTKERRSSLAPIDQNVNLVLEPVKLDPPSQVLSSQQSPKLKPSFNGPDIIQLSPSKSSKIASLNNYYSQDKQREPINRLVIDRLVLTNFKSYAGQQIIGPFHTSFSSVVGPNGSGKSNVIDAMLFVFGFRANKMRQGKLSELIHNSEAAPNLDSCSVDIHFLHVTDNLDDTTTAVADSQLIVSRRAYRNNSSDYFINSKKSSYGEVTKLLKDKGIDLDHKRFLILQGEVESIAQMKPKAEKENDDGLLEYLEDIIGTSSYKSTIEDSYQKIEELNEVCQEKESRFSLVEKERDALESKKQEALDFIFNEKELLGNQSLLYQFKIHKSNKNIEMNNSVLSDLQEKLKSEQSESSGFQKDANSLEKEYSVLLKSISSIDEEVKKLEDFQRKGDREKVAVEEKKKSLENKRKKAEKLLDTSLSAIREASTKHSTLCEENEKFCKDLERLKESVIAEKAILDEIRAELTDKTKGFNEEIEIYERKLQPWNVKLEEKKSAITIAESRVQMLKDQRSGLDREISQLNDRLQAIVQEGKDEEKRLDLLKKEKAHNTSQIELGEQECQHAAAKLKEMEESVANDRQRAIEARGSLSTIQNKNKVLSGLMRLQESGRIQGFYGRLGDLGYIDDRYDVAISTACGQLDDMVVETVEVGQQCIEYLRKNNLGYARFILLTKLRKFNLNKIQTPKNVPRLFDLVTPQDPKFASAFYSVLQDTLVASDLREANLVAYGAKRFRVVTLDGKLIDKSGTLSGGGNVVSRGGMKSASQTGSVSESEVTELERQLSEKERKYETAQNAYYEMTDALKQLNERQPEIDTERSKVTFQIESLTNEMKNIQTQLIELMKAKEAMNANNAEIVSAEKSVMSLTAEFNRLKDETIEIQGKINDLQEKILNVGGVKLRMQNSKVDSVNQQIEISSQKINNNKGTIKKLETEIKRYTKSQTEKKAEITAYVSELAKVEKVYQEKICAFEKIDVELKRLMDDKEDKNEKAESLKESLDEKLEKINLLKSAQVEIENKVERHQSLLKHEMKQLNEYVACKSSLEFRDVSHLLAFIEDEQERAKYAKPSLSELPPDEIEALNIEDIERRVEGLEDFMSKAKVDIDILEEYGRRTTEYQTRKLDLNEAVQRRDEIKKSAEELKKKRLDDFMEGFNIISATLKEMYQMITMGGNAELELVDSLDPFSEGILFSVMPPKKSWKNISNLSGGEKTLSSLALVFALHRYKPTPLYVMDEIDAALDFRNVSIVANYIKERTKNAQFIVISLRNNMFELAQQLVGIYKVNNMTRSITLQNRDMLSNEQ
jgi:structural maintenance of chromosome 4